MSSSSVASPLAVSSAVEPLSALAEDGDGSFLPDGDEDLWKEEYFDLVSID